MPDYMRASPQQYLYDDIESCCENYYQWEEDVCIENSGGNTVATATGKWYVNHQEEVCVQDCPKSVGGYCGGLAKEWDQLYNSEKDCCDVQLSWIASSVCEARSTLTTPTGSSRYYVDWGVEKVRFIKSSSSLLMTVSDFKSLYHVL